MAQLTYSQTRALEDIEMHASNMAKVIMHHLPRSEHRTTLLHTLDTVRSGASAAVIKGDGE